MKNWTRKRVTILAVTLFVAHIVAIFALHTPAPMVALPKDFRVSRLPATALTAQPAVEMDGLNDPLVFAGAHEHGFSASAWMMRPRQQYALTNAMPPPRFLAFARTPAEFPSDEVFPQPAANLPFLQIALPKVASKSILLVEGDLEKRPLLGVPELPIQFGTDVLSNTVVQVGVQADGFPFSARIVSGSGSRAADLKALDIAKNLRFGSLPPARRRDPAELQWGEFVFQWFTTEPPGTNAPPPAAGGPGSGGVGGGGR